MKSFCIMAVIMLAIWGAGSAQAQTNSIPNPLIWADVPDISIERVGDKYYMSSTTMHMAPGVPIMESSDLVNWKTVTYVYSTLADNQFLNLQNDTNAYGRGSWASSIRHKNGTWYVLVPSYTTGKSHLYSTTNLLKGPWKEVRLPFWHDPSLHLDDDGRNYVVYGGGDIKIVELTADLSAVKAGGLNKTLIPDASGIVAPVGLAAEGAHIEKVNGYYYVFTITWPTGKGRTALVHRSRTLDGVYEGRVALQNQGVAQGSIIQTPDGQWYGYLFQDNGSVGRVPWLLPLSWQNDWPVFGTNGTAPTSISMNAALPTDGYGMVVSDDFTSTTLPLEWQWNHNPLNTHWSLNARPGYMRITSSRTDNHFLKARNTLTQRTYGPRSSAQVALETAGLKDGDFAGLGALQKQYGLVGVKRSGNSKFIVMVNAVSGVAQEIQSIALSQDRVYLRVDMDFQNRTDKATFYYSLNGTTWNRIGNTLQMSYTLPHFMGYRFALFHYSTQSTGGYADFDWFKIGNTYNNTLPFVNFSDVSSSSLALSSSSSSQTVSRQPFRDIIAIPGILQLEDYDVGGSGVTFFDSDADNRGNVYRNDAVDIVMDESNYFIGYTAHGEWLEYSVNVQHEGPLNFTCRVAAAGESGKFSLLLDGVRITDTLSVPNTGSWTTFTEISGKTTPLPQGQHTLRFHVDSAWFNIDWINFEAPTTVIRSAPGALWKPFSGSGHWDLLGRPSAPPVYQND